MQIEHIFVGRKRGGELIAVTEISALAGQGLAGDRYCTTDNQADPSRQLTLIEAEEIEAYARTSGNSFDYASARRNVVTRAVRLNPLVGKTFLVGDVLLRGTELCEPCAGLEAQTHPGLVKAWVHKAGLNCEILTDGTLRVGAIFDLEPEVAI